MNKSVAQPYYFRHYQVENGLSNNSVNCSIQDKNGFLWFGTKEGLNRFDGYRFKLFNLSDNESRTSINELIYSLFTDKDGTVWVGSQIGLYKFDAEKERLVPFIDSLIEVSCIQSDNSGQLWFRSWGDVCRYNFETKKLTRFPEKNNFAVTAICKSEDGTMWFSSIDGFLYRFDTATESFKGFDIFSHSPRPTSRWTSMLRSAGNGSIFIGTSSQGIKQFDIASSTYKDVLIYNSDQTTIFVRDILQYSTNEFWFATESGIFILDMKTQQFTNLKKKFLDPYTISDNAVYTLCKDTEGGVWAGTFFGGVNYFPKQYSIFQKFFPDYSKNSISGSAVREICEDAYNNIWIGTEDAGLNKLNTETGTFTHFEPTGSKTSIAYSNIHGLLLVGDDLWIGTFEHGVDIMDVKTGKVKQHFISGPGKNELKSNFGLCFLQTKDGEIYLGTSNGVYRYQKKTNDFERLSPMPDNFFVAALEEDHDHNILIGSHGRGLFIFNPHTKNVEHFENQPGNIKSLTNNTINAIMEDSDQNIWVSTEGGGLCKLDRERKSFTSYGIKEGLPSNFIFKVIEDDGKKLWVSTSRGLVNMNNAGENITIYTKENGLLNDQFNYNSGYKDAKGKIYMGSIKGMITFMPQRFYQQSFTPSVFITGFQVHNKELEIDKDSSFLKKSIIYTNEITLPYDQSSFSIDFAALGYTSPERTEYSYKMDGLDKEWIYLKSNRKVYFTNLAPGKYIFHVKAGTPGPGTKKEKQLIIQVLPPFWATSWAYLAYTLMAAALLYYLIRSYHKRTQEKKEKEIYEAKFDFFTNVAHEIKTPLTLIKGPVENLLEKIDELPGIKDDVNTMNRNTNRLIALITQILDFRQTETKGFSLDFTRINLNELLEELYLNFKPLASKRSLIYSIKLPPDPVFVFADEDGLQKIFSNLFSNAIKYAATEVDIKLYIPEKDHTNFTVEFSNDGFIIPAEMKERIFEPFFRLKETIKQKGTGIGLALARSLAELHKGVLYLKDTGNDKNNFVVCLPLKPEETEVAKRNHSRTSVKTK